MVRKMADFELKIGLIRLAAGALALICPWLLVTGSPRAGNMPSPAGLSVELLTSPGKTVIRDLEPEFGWEVRSLDENILQTGYRIQVKEPGVAPQDVIRWDSGRVESSGSVNVVYRGPALEPGRHYAWRVKVWDNLGNVSAWSDFQEFRIAGDAGAYRTSSYSLETRLVKAVRFRKSDRGYFYDFGKAAFGTVQVLLPPLARSLELEIRLGEKLADGEHLDRNPPGSIRYREFTLKAGPGTRMAEAAIPPDPRNTRPGAVAMPDCIGEVLPFRYCEIAAPGIELGPESVTMKAVNYPFNDQAADFISSSKELNAVWDLCKYTIKATSFTGIYVDGDRERIAYEADAYINQLGHYLTDREYSMARVSHEYLIRNPTWPTEWILHSVLMAWEDYLYTGNLESAEHYYQDLRNKTLFMLTAGNGLISTSGDLIGRDVLASVHLKDEMRDIVDWPPGSFTEGGTGERDGHVMTEYNTVVNAFHYRALVLFARLAEALGRDRDATEFSHRASSVREALNALMLDPRKGIYRDGIGTDHSSLHANMFPLVFGLVPDEYLGTVTSFVKSRGMACSVYGAQYLLDALFTAEESEAALDLLTARNDRGWLNMLAAGTTVTLEAWDWKYKNNLDWNHAWGAAPANLIPRWILGVQPLKPGFEELRICPHPGGLEWARGEVPTIRGPVKAGFSSSRVSFELEVELPANTRARIEVPAGKRVLLDGEAASREMERGRAILFCGSGTHSVRVEDPEF